jgi:hypothetical protein
MTKYEFQIELQDLVDHYRDDDCGDYLEFDWEKIFELIDRYKSIPPAEQKIANYETILERMVELYEENPSCVANVCDMVLDRSGTLLGVVRERSKQ